MRPWSSDGEHASRALLLVASPTNGPVAAVSGTIAKPMKSPPPNVIVYSVLGVYVEALGKAGEKVKPKAPLPL